MRDRVVFQSVVGRCETIRVTEPFARAYAAKVGAEYVLLKDPQEPPTILSAILTAKRALENVCQTARQTLWLDADVYVRPTAPDIFAEVPDGHIGAWCDEGRLNAESIPPHPMYPHGHFNAGVLVWPSAAHGVMQRAVEFCTTQRGLMTEGERARMIWDQTAMNRAVAESGIPVHALDIAWNHHQTEARVKRFGLRPVSEAHFVHFAGGHHLPQNALSAGEKVSQGIRAKQMQDWIKEHG